MNTAITAAIVLIPCAQLRAAPLIVAHRGASQDAPENTLRAFSLAWAQGADAIEGDFRLTKDGEIVCVHDADTERVAGTKMIVKDSTLEGLRALDVGVWRGREWAGTTIPTMAEVLATVPKGKRIYVEIKCGTEIIPALLERLDRAGLDQDQIVVISFNAAVIEAVKAKAPEFKAFWLLGFRKDDSGRVTPSIETVLETLKETGAEGLSSAHGLTTESIVRRVLDAGYEYHVWTVDDPATARRFAEWGAMSITTNVPGPIKDHLVDRDAVPDADRPRR